MKRNLLIPALFLSLSLNAQQFKVVTIVESIVPMGIGRSRMIESTQRVDADAATTERADGKKSDQKDVDRSDLKIDNFKETKLLNFYSGVGINFQNIASNDAMIADKMTKLTAEGWQLLHITSGVESDAGKEDGNGIFITRMYFKKD